MASSVSCAARPFPWISGPALFVFGVWIAMSVVAFAFLSRYAVNVPYAEDGMLIPYVTGAEAVDGKFLWYVYSNHIIPIPKLAMIGLVRLTGDFRSSMYASVIVCTAVSLLLMLAGRLARGRMEYSDAFFSVGLLHLGHWESFLLGFAIQEVMSVVLLALILFVILRSGTRLSRGQALLVGLCLIFLPTTGMAGFLLVPCLTLWLGYHAWLTWREGAPGAGVTVSLHLVLLLAIGASLLPYLATCAAQPAGIPWYLGPARWTEKAEAFLAVLLQVTAVGFGSSTGAGWLPFPGHMGVIYIVGGTVLGLAFLVQLSLLRRLPREDRLRRVGLSLFLVSSFLLLAGIAFGRCGASRTIGLSPRYSLYSIPLLWGLYFAWQIYGSQRGRFFVPLAMFGFTVAMFSLNMYQGCIAAQDRHDILQAVQRDLTTPSVPACDIATTYNKYISGCHWVCYKLKGIGDDQNLICREMTRYVDMLRQAGIRPLRVRHIALLALLALLAGAGTFFVIHLLGKVGREGPGKKTGPVLVDSPPTNRVAE